MSDEQTRTLDDDAREARIGRILDDFLTRRARGENVTDAELLAQHPDLADDLREHLELLGELRPPADQVAALITQGLLTRCEDARYPAELGAYKILGYIGRGGMGIVLKAYEESLDRTVALKILRPELAGDGVALERFIREAKAAAALRHPNIVTVHAVGEHHGVHFLAMEHVEGASLADLICSQGPLPTETSRHIFHQLLEALAAAHDAGLIHRDVKSSNILLDGQPSRERRSDEATKRRRDRIEGESPSTGDSAVAEPQTLNPEPSASVKLADFGLARMITAQTRVTLGDSILGTPEYMSPEQARGDSEINHRSDLYSAGVVLYEMLTGRTPFRADMPSAVIHQILNVDPPEPRTFNQDVDPVLASLSLRLMAKSPEDRFLSATEAIMALNAGERVSSPQHCRRVRGLLAHGSLIVAALLVIVGLLWQFLIRTPVISDVQIGPDGRTVQFLYVGDSEATRVHRFPRDVETINDHPLLDIDGSGKQLGVVGLEKPLQDGANVIAFDAKRNEAWRQSVTNLGLNQTWPDCGGSPYWVCRRLAFGNLDGVPGDELVVAANDAGDCPTRISRINPRNGAVISTFWHMGQFTDLWVLPEFLGPGRAAVLGRGSNNKLDGFDTPLPGDAEPYTSYEVVDVIVVLDPANMNGLGPPNVDPSRLPLLPVIPHAYAFLEQPQTVADTTNARGGQSGDGPPMTPGALTIRKIEPSTAGSVGGEPFLRVPIGRKDEKEDCGWIFTLDLNLQLKHVTTVDGEPLCPSEDYWRTRWRVIIQNGEYVDR